MHPQYLAYVVLLFIACKSNTCVVHIEYITSPLNCRRRPHFIQRSNISDIKSKKVTMCCRFYHFLQKHICTLKSILSLHHLLQFMGCQYYTMGWSLMIGYCITYVCILFRLSLNTSIPYQSNGCDIFIF